MAGFGVINAALAGGLNVLGPVVADDTIGRPAWGLVLAVETAGMVVGGIVALECASAGSALRRGLVPRRRAAARAPSA